MLIKYLAFFSVTVLLVTGCSSQETGSKGNRSGAPTTEPAGSLARGSVLPLAADATGDCEPGEGGATVCETNEDGWACAYTYDEEGELVAASCQGDGITASCEAAGAVLVCDYDLAGQTCTERYDRETHGLRDSDCDWDGDGDVDCYTHDAGMACEINDGEVTCQYEFDPRGVFLALNCHADGWRILCEASEPGAVCTETQADGSECQLTMDSEWVEIERVCDGSTDPIECPDPEDIIPPYEPDSEDEPVDCYSIDWVGCGPNQIEVHPDCGCGCVDIDINACEDAATEDVCHAAEGCVAGYTGRCDCTCEGPEGYEGGGCDECAPECFTFVACVEG